MIIFDPPNSSAGERADQFHLARGNSGSGVGYDRGVGNGREAAGDELSVLSTAGDSATLWVGSNHCGRTNYLWCILSDRVNSAVEYGRLIPR